MWPHLPGSQAPFTALGTTAEPQGATCVPHVHPLGGSGGTAADPVGLANLCVSVWLSGYVAERGSLQVPQGLGTRNSLSLHANPSPLLTRPLGLNTPARGHLFCELRP